MIHKLVNVVDCPSPQYQLYTFALEELLVTETASPTHIWVGETVKDAIGGLDTFTIIELLDGAQTESISLIVH